MKVALACVRYLLPNGPTYGGEIWQADACRVCVTYGLGLMSIGVIIGKKMTILKHCVECVCTLKWWIYIDCSAGQTPATSSKAATPRWLLCDPDRGASVPRRLVTNTVHSLNSSAMITAPQTLSHLLLLLLLYHVLPLVFVCDHFWCSLKDLQSFSHETFKDYWSGQRICLSSNQ